MKGNLQSELSNRKRIFLNLIMIIIPLILLVLLEFGLRLFNYGYDLRLCNKSGFHPGYYEINKKVGKRYFTRFEETNPPNDLFLINKPDSCFRIFVMGESTTQGFPYHFGTTFSRILNYRLQDAFPHKLIEVINTGMSAVNSFALVDIMDEILKQKPDLILVYAGHNEYYGALGVGSVENGGNIRWLKILHLKLVRFRTYQLLQKSITGIANLSSSNKSQRGGSLMTRIVKDKSIEFNSELFQKGLDQFGVNMSEIIEMAKKAGIPVILSDQVSNIRNQKPFKSIKTKKFPGADEVFIQARKAESDGEYDKARELYYQAKDLDVIRFRAPEALNNIITGLGKKYNVPVVPMREYFEKNSPNGLIGDNLMLEHLHPNLNGYFLMADAFFNTIRKDGLIAPVWDTTLIRHKEYYRNNWGFTRLDSLVADIQIKMIKNGWPFKPENEKNNVLYYNPVTYEDSIAYNHMMFKTRIEEDHLKLAEHYASHGENMAAFNEFYSLIKSYPHTDFLYYEALKYLYQSNEYQKALDLMLSLPGKDTSYIALFQIGQIYSRLYMPEKAISFFNAANKVIKPGDKVELSSENAEVEKLIDQAISLGKQGNFDKALEVLYKSLAIKETWRANQLIGNIMFRKKDMKALGYYEKAYKGSPKNQDILNNLFVIYIMKKDFDKASKCLDELKHISTDYAKIHRLEKLLNNSMNGSI